MTKNDLMTMRINGTGLDHDGWYWKPEDRTQLLQMFYEGMGISEIALTMKRSEPAIMQQLCKEECFRNEVKKRNRKKKLKNRCRCGECLNSDICKMKRTD